MNNPNHQLIVTAFIIALGYLVKRFGIVSEKDGQVLSKVIINITLPALIIDVFSGIKIDFSLGILPIISITSGILLSAAGIIFFKNEDKSLKGVLASALPGFNVGLFAFPIAEAMWGDKGLKYFAMIDAGNAFIVLGASYILACVFSPERKGVDVKYVVKRVLTFIPLLLYIITVGVNLMGLKFPEIIAATAKTISKANAPLSLITLGIYFNISVEKHYIKSIFKVLSIRYGVGIALGLLFYMFMPKKDILREVLLMVSILPMGFSVIPYAVEFGYDGRLAGAIVNFANIISFLLIWIIFVI